MPSLDIRDMSPDPIVQFRRWFAEAEVAHPQEPNAMTLATATPDGHPSARMVLLKGVDERGFTFYTNYESRKGDELTSNPYAALVFFWVELHRQVRIEGSVEKVSPSESDAYFQTRARGSQLGAAASPQSRVIPDRTYLEQRVARLEDQWRDGAIPRPEYWGGYRLRPSSIEFWQGRENRLHDRIRYRREQDSWVRERLAP